jgi:hypothetical protein
MRSVAKSVFWGGCLAAIAGTCLVGTVQAGLLMDIQITGKSTDNGASWTAVTDPKTITVNPGDELQLHLYARLPVAGSRWEQLQSVYANVVQNVHGASSANAGTFTGIGQWLFDNGASPNSVNDTGIYTNPFLTGLAAGLPAKADLNGDGVLDLGSNALGDTSGRFGLRAGSMQDTRAPSLGIYTPNGFDLGAVVWKAGTNPTTNINVTLGSTMPNVGVALWKEGTTSTDMVTYQAGGSVSTPIVQGWSSVTYGADVVVNEVPEPTTLALIGAGLVCGGLVWVRRRKS